MSSPHDTLKYPVATEKAIRLLESNNTLIFVVAKKATKQEIKKSMQDLFKASVKTVNTLVTTKGEKHAYIRLNASTPAIDIATNLGLM